MSDEEKTGDDPSVLDGMPYQAVWSLAIHGGTLGDKLHLELEGKITLLIDSLRDKYPDRVIETEWTPWVMSAPSRQI